LAGRVQVFVLVVSIQFSLFGCGLGFVGDPNAAPFREGDINLVAAALNVYQGEWGVLPADVRGDGEALEKLKYVYEFPEMPGGLFEEMGLTEDRGSGVTVSTKFVYANRPGLLFSSRLPEQFVLIEKVPDASGVAWAVTSRGQLLQLAVGTNVPFQPQALLNSGLTNAQATGIEVSSAKNLHLVPKVNGSDLSE